MSPTEDDLRSALSDGAGDVPNADHIVVTARAHRARRRTRLLSATAAVVVVGGVAAGGTLLAQHGSPGGSPRTRATVAGGGAAGTTSSGTNDGVNIPRPSVACPSRVPDTMLPGGGGTSQFGATGNLFTQPVHTVTVCAYPVAGTSSGTPARIGLSGSDATILADSLEHASPSRPSGVCSDLREADQTSLVIIATTAAGTQLPTVITTINEPSCAVRVTNGTAVRYAWAPPAGLREAFTRLSSDARSAAPAASPSSAGAGSPSTLVPPSERVNGSPAH